MKTSLSPALLLVAVLFGVTTPMRTQTPRDTTHAGTTEDLPADVAAHAKQTLSAMIDDAERLRVSALADLPGKEAAIGQPGWPSANWKLTREGVEAWFNKPLADLRSRLAAVDTDLSAARSNKLALDGYGGFYARTYGAVWESGLALWSLHQVETCEGRVPLLTFRAVVTYRQYTSEMGAITNKYGYDTPATRAEMAKNTARWDALRHQTFTDIALGERLLVSRLQAARGGWAGELRAWADAAKARSKATDDIHDWAAKKSRMAVGAFNSLSSCNNGGLVDTRYSDYEWAKRRPYPDVQTNPAYPGDITLDMVLKTRLESLPTRSTASSSRECKAVSLIYLPNPIKRVFGHKEESSSPSLQFLPVGCTKPQAKARFDFEEPRVRMFIQFYHSATVNSETGLLTVPKTYAIPPVAIGVSVGTLHGSTTVGILGYDCQKMELHRGHEAKPLAPGTWEYVWDEYEPVGCHSPYSPLQIDSEDSTVARLEGPPDLMGHRLTAVAAGRTKITATRGGLRDTLEVVVSSDPVCSKAHLHYDNLDLVLSEEDRFDPRSESSLPQVEYEPQGCARPTRQEFYVPGAVISQYASVRLDDPKSGIVQAVSEGPEKVCVSSDRSWAELEDCVQFHVHAPPCRKLDLVYEPNLLVVGQAAAPTLKYSPKGCERPIKPLSFDVAADAESIAAQVDEKTGQLTGKAPGKPTISVVHGNYLKASTTVEVNAPDANCKELRVAYSPPAVAVGTRSAEPVLSYLPQGCTLPGTSPGPQFRIDREGFGIDKATGVVTPGYRASARVSVEHGSLSASTGLDVTSKPPCTSMNIAPASLSVEANLSDFFRLPVFSPNGCEPPFPLTCTSQDQNVARVDCPVANVGPTVHGVSPGQTLMRFEQGYVSASASVTVTARRACSGIELTYPSLGSIYPGNLTAAKVAYTPANCLSPERPPVFGSLSPEIAEVRASTGELWGIAPGAATIEVVQGLLRGRAMVKLNALEACTSLLLAYPDMRVATRSRPANLYYSYPDNCIRPPGKARFATSTPDIADIDPQSGVIAAKKSGEATFQVIHGSLSNSTTIRIFP